MRASIRHFCSRLNQFSTLIVAIATVALAVITFFYLRETRLHRVSTQEAISIDTSPKVFISAMKPHFTPNLEKNSIDLRTPITIKNSGKTEAKNLNLSYTVKRGQQELKGTPNPWQYLFPGQECVCNTKFLEISIKPEDVPRAKEAIESKKNLTINL